MPRQHPSAATRARRDSGALLRATGLVASRSKGRRRRAGGPSWSTCTSITSQPEDAQGQGRVAAPRRSHAQEKFRSPNLSLFLPKSSAELTGVRARQDGRVRAPRLFHSSFSPSSAQLSTETPTKAIPHPLPPRYRQKYALFHAYRTAQDGNQTLRWFRPVHLKPQNWRWS